VKIKSLQFALIILSILIIGPLYAQDQSTISGVVKDEKTGEALSGASVFLKGTHIGGTAGEDGKYSFAKVPNGKWVLVCSRLSYIKVEKEIDIADKNNYTFSFSLKPDDITFSDVVITATRNEALVTSIPVATDVLTAKNIEESNAKNVGEALQNVGDSFIKSYGGVGSLETVSLRGSTDSQVLILIDGQRLNNAQSGSVDLSSIPTNAIERIEVVKGGNAAMYGSDAVGGVVNIITKSMARKNDLNLSANGLYGTYNTRIIDLSAAQGLGNFDYFLSYNRTQTDGNYPYTDVNGKQVNFQNSDTKADNIFFKAGYLFDDNSHLSFFHKYYRANNGSPGSTDFPNYTSRNKYNNNHSSISYEGLSTGPFAFNFNAYYMNQEQHYINPESYLGTEENVFYTKALGFLAQAFTDLNQLGLLSYGYEFRQDKLTSGYFVNGLSQPFYGDHQRNVNSLYFQDDWKYELNSIWKLNLVPAVRLDNYPEASIGSQFSPKIGINLSHDEIWRGSVRGNVGKVYRAPTYNDLYWPEDSFTKGNPNLRPEKGLTYDFGFIVQFKAVGSWSVESTYFASMLEDLILWAPGAVKWMPTNIAKAKTTGIESKVVWHVFDSFLNLQASYTNMSAKDDGNDPTTSGKYLIYRPKDQYNLGLNLSYGIGSFNIFYNFVGKRFHDAQNTIELSSYSLINANIGVSPKIFGVNLNLRLEGNNLGNKEIQITQGTPIPGREIRFSVGLAGSITGLN
jgi:outer membrane cobalamin receptor